MTEHWPLLGREGAHTGWTESTQRGRPWGNASWSSLHCSGWTSSRRHAGRSWEWKGKRLRIQTQPQRGEERRGEERRGEERRGEERLTWEWTTQTSHTGVRPNCPPSWCETESCSSLSVNPRSPLLAEGLCSRWCRPETEDNHNLRVVFA